MRKENVYIGTHFGQERANFECSDELLDKVARSSHDWRIFGSKKMVFDNVVDSITFALVYNKRNYHSYSEPLNDGSRTCGWWGTSEVFAIYRKETNTFEIVRIGEIMIDD